MSDMSVSLLLLQRVRINLLYMNSWTNVQIYNSTLGQLEIGTSSVDSCESILFLTGFPPHSLHPQPATSLNIEPSNGNNNERPAALEFVFPVCIGSQDLTMQQIDSIFSSIGQTRVELNDQKIQGSSEEIQESQPRQENQKNTKTIDSLPLLFGRPARIILAIVSDDGTIVYYFVHDGLVKPKKN